MTDIFTPQLSPDCTVICGTTRVQTNGLNCTCACHRSWLYRATHGRVNTSACHVRDLTNDCTGGNTLDQMVAVSQHYGVSGGRLYRPGNPTTILGLVRSRRYATHWQIHYSVIRPTSHDASRHAFGGNHDVLLVGPGARTGTTRVMDPLADGRYTGCPDGFADWPDSLLVAAAAALDVRARPSDPYKALGTGRVYAYVTPADEVAAAPHYRATVTTATALWNDATKRWTFNGTNALKKGTLLEVRGAGYAKGGVRCYPVVGPAPYQPSYYVPVSKVKLSPI